MLKQKFHSLQEEFQGHVLKVLSESISRSFPACAYSHADRLRRALIIRFDFFNKTPREIKFEEGTGNVFKDLGLDKPEDRLANLMRTDKLLL